MDAMAFTMDAGTLRMAHEALNVDAMRRSVDAGTHTLDAMVSNMAQGTSSRDALDSRLAIDAHKSALKPSP